MTPTMLAANSSFSLMVLGVDKLRWMVLAGGLPCECNQVASGVAVI